VEIFLKLASRDYERLRDHVPSHSSAREAMDKATPIDHSVEGVQFQGYDVACNEDQARIILETAKHCCPEIIPKIEEAIRIARTE
jgi:hypothetical protein